MKKNGQAAAFYDLEGTLVSTNLVHTLAFYSRRQQGLFSTIKKTVGTLAKLPLFGATDLYSRNVFNEFFFQSYKGESEDRLRFFSEELFEEVLKPAIFDGTSELIAQSKKIGQRQVVITGADFTIDRLCNIWALTNTPPTVSNSSTGTRREEFCRRLWQARQKRNGCANIRKKMTSI